MTRKTSIKLDNIDRAYNKLHLFLTVQNPSELEKTGVIKAFEYTFELFWKTFKAQGEMDGLVLPSPRTALAYAWQAGIITSEDVWLDMLEKRNLAVHTYNEDQAQEIFSSIKEQFAAEFQKSLERLHRQHT